MAFTSAQPYSWVPLVVYGVLTAVVQIADFVLPSKLTAKFGGSKAAERGSTIGTILGMFFVPWGLILFPFFGALIGEWMYNKQASAGHLFKVAFGAFLAFLFGTGLKLILTCWMLVDVVIEICAMLF
jgi:uncharacterized protein YqgC (DUF456 family)